MAVQSTATARYQYCPLSVPACSKYLLYTHRRSHTVRWWPWWWPLVRTCCQNWVRARPPCLPPRPRLQPAQPSAQPSAAPPSAARVCVLVPLLSPSCSHNHSPHSKKAAFDQRPPKPPPALCLFPLPLLSLSSLPIQSIHTTAPLVSTSIWLRCTPKHKSLLALYCRPRFSTTASTEHSAPPFAFLFQSISLSRAPTSRGRIFASLHRQKSSLLRRRASAPIALHLTHIINTARALQSGS